MYGVTAGELRDAVVVAGDAAALLLLAVELRDHGIVVDKDGLQEDRENTGAGQAAAGERGRVLLVKIAIAGRCIKLALSR